MSSKVRCIGIQKRTKMIKHDVHIRSTDQFNQVGVYEKNDRSEKFLNCLLTDSCALNLKFFSCWM